jgi:hypothetical protein
MIEIAGLEKISKLALVNELCRIKNSFDALLIRKAFY